MGFICHGSQVIRVARLQIGTSEVRFLSVAIGGNYGYHSISTSNADVNGAYFDVACIGFCGLRLWDMVVPALIAVDTESREYPNVPLWCRISEAHPSFPIQHKERLSFEQLNTFVCDYVVGDKEITEETAAEYGLQYKRLWAIRRNMLREISGEKKVKPPGHKRKYKPEPLVVEYIEKYLIERSCAEIGTMIGRNKDTIAKAAKHIGYRYRHARGNSRWLAPGEI